MIATPLMIHDLRHALRKAMDRAPRPSVTIDAQRNGAGTGVDVTITFSGLTSGHADVIRNMTISSHQIVNADCGSIAIDNAIGASSP